MNPPTSDDAFVLANEDSEDVDMGGRAQAVRSVRLSYEADNVDRAAYSTDTYTDNASGSDDESEDQQENEEDDSRQVVDNDQSDEVSREQHIRAAAARLRMAWGRHCTCGGWIQLLEHRRLH